MTNLRKALLADHAFRYDIGVEQRADRAVAIVAAWLRDEADADHRYVSTACLHGQHDECRLVCKFCPTACGCVCGHDRAATPPTPEPGP